MNWKFWESTEGETSSNRPVARLAGALVGAYFVFMLLLAWWWDD